MSLVLYESKSNRRRWVTFKRFPAKKQDRRQKRNDVFHAYSMAADSRVGVVCYVHLAKIGIINAKFLDFVVGVLLPPIRGTGPIQSSYYGQP